MLRSHSDIKHFAENVLGIRNGIKLHKAVETIEAAENSIAGRLIKNDTLNSNDFWDTNYDSKEKRENLRAQIVKELIEKPRLDNDDAIKLRHGGAAPKTQVRSDKNAFYVVGSPASGKSGISNMIADAYGCYVLDSDYAKRKLPEYRKVGGASLVHEESDALIFSYKRNNLFDFCVENGHNIVIPKIGHSTKGVYDYCKALKESKGYSVYLVSVELDRFKCTQRAYTRFLQTKRYVPLSLVFDSYSNEPTLSYFRLKQKNDGVFAGFAQISADVAKGDRPILVEQVGLDLMSKLGGAKING